MESDEPAHEAAKDERLLLHPHPEGEEKVVMIYDVAGHSERKQHRMTSAMSSGGMPCGWPTISRPMAPSAAATSSSRPDTVTR